MPYVLIVALQVLTVVHIVRNGHNTLWVWLVIFAPVVGSLAYFLVEGLPAIRHSRSMRRVATYLRRTVDPTRDLRQAQYGLQVNSSVESRRKVADELLLHGQYKEAMEHYRAAMTGIFEHDPLLMLGLAKTQFALNEAALARQTLATLIEKNPEFKSSEGHLLYARALESEGQFERALQEYQVLIKYYIGAEARYRHAALLQRLGQMDVARSHLQSLLDDAAVGGAHYRAEQREWLTLAKKALEK